MWHYFKNEYPKKGKSITIIWSDGCETDVIWNGKNSVDWSITKMLPILWKYI